MTSIAGKRIKKHHLQSTISSFFWILLTEIVFGEFSASKVDPHCCGAGGRPEPKIFGRFGLGSLEFIEKWHVILVGFPRIKGNNGVGFCIPGCGCSCDIPFAKSLIPLNIFSSNSTWTETMMTIHCEKKKRTDTEFATNSFWVLRKTAKLRCTTWGLPYPCNSG